MKYKTVDQSKVSIGNLMQPDQANIEGNVHGGEVIKLMDSCAGEERKLYKSGEQRYLRHKKIRDIRKEEEKDEY